MTEPDRTHPTRTERDSLGEREVPQEAYWGIQTQRAVENYPISGQTLGFEMVQACATIKLAAAQVHRDLGLLEPEVADAIIQASREVREGKWSEDFVVDAFQAGAGTSFHMNVNEVIANRANELLGYPRGSYQRVNPNDDVNMGQSTNDVFPTTMRLALLVMLTALSTETDALAKSFRRKAEEFGGIVKSGRTHLQDAVPVRLGQEFGGYAQAIAKGRRRIETAREPLHELGIGGSAAGTGLNTHPEYRTRMIAELRKLTGLPVRAGEDLFELMQSMTPFADVSAALRNLALDVTRIASDLRLLSSGPRTGLAEITLPAVQPGSSIMPGKVNPSIPEMVNQVCWHVMGADTAVAYAVQAGQLELNVMMPVIAYELVFATRIMTNSSKVFRERCVDGLVANEEACRRFAERSLGLATVLNPVIGYAKAADLAKEAFRSDRSVLEVVRERGLLTPEVEQALSPRVMTEPGTL
ncbi:Fumarate hydratase class II [compost metagenome]